MFNFNNDRIVFFRQVLKTIGLNYSYVRYEIKGVNDGTALGPKQGFFILSIMKSQFDDYLAHDFVQHLAGLKVEIEYYSVKGIKKKIVWLGNSMNK